MVFNQFVGVYFLVYGFFCIFLSNFFYIFFLFYRYSSLIFFCGYNSGIFSNTSSFFLRERFFFDSALLLFFFFYNSVSFFCVTNPYSFFIERSMIFFLSFFIFFLNFICEGFIFSSGSLFLLTYKMCVYLLVVGYTSFLLLYWSTNLILVYIVFECVIYITFFLVVYTVSYHTNLLYVIDFVRIYDGLFQQYYANCYVSGYMLLYIIFLIYRGVWNHLNISFLCAVCLEFSVCDVFSFFNAEIYVLFSAFLFKLGFPPFIFFFFLFYNMLNFLELTFYNIMFLFGLVFFFF